MRKNLWPWALAAYAVVGIAVGTFIGIGTKARVPGDWIDLEGVAAGVQLLLPAGLILCAVWYPRITTALAGAAIAGITFLLAMTGVHAFQVGNWKLSQILVGGAPAAIIATLWGGFVAALTVLVANLFLTVGFRDAHLRCKECGYALVGLETQRTARCPECGTVGRDAKQSGGES